MLYINLREDYMYLNWSNFSVDIATFSKPVSFKVNLLYLVARIRKIELDLGISQKLIPAKSWEDKNGKILYSQNSNNNVFGVLLFDSVRYWKSFDKLFGV